MSELEYRDTAAGRYRESLGVLPENHPQVVAERMALIDARVDEARAAYRQRGLRLTEAQADELRSRLDVTVRTSVGGAPPADSYELAKRAGWNVLTANAGKPGFAMRLNGEWTPDSDPRVVAATEAGEADRARLVADFERRPRLYERSNGVAGPS